MSSSRFTISTSAVNAYRFVWREKRYLLKAAVVPVGVNLLTTLFLSGRPDDISVIENFLWTLPYTALSAWFMFLETRLILFGERLETLPTDVGYLAERQQRLRASALIWMLFNMGVIVIASYLAWSSDISMAGQDKNALVTTGAMLLIGGGFWALRLSPAHILAAAGYPIKKFIRETQGMGISFRLIGLGFVAALPIMTVVHFLLKGMISSPADLTRETIMNISLIMAPISILLSAILNAAGVFALKEMLGRKDGNDARLRRVA